MTSYLYAILPRMRLGGLVLLGLGHAISAQTISSNSTGTSNGFFYSFWNDGSGGSASMTLEGPGAYSTRWDKVGNFTAGIGWKPGGRKDITFSGSFDGGFNGYLAVYGWTTEPLVEYYIVEAHGRWTPPGGSPVGTVVSDGDMYNIYKSVKTDAPSIKGVATFSQYWSVRATPRTSGTITTKNHFEAWAQLGMNLGKFDYQILATEGFHSTGSSRITVAEASSDLSSTSGTTVVSASPVENAKPKKP